MREDKSDYGTIPEEGYIKQVFHPLYVMSGLIRTAGIVMLIGVAFEIVMFVLLRVLPESSSPFNLKIFPSGLMDIVFGIFLLRASSALRNGWESSSLNEIYRGVSKIGDFFSLKIILIIIGIVFIFMYLFIVLIKTVLKW